MMKEKLKKKQQQKVNNEIPKSFYFFNETSLKIIFGIFVLEIFKLYN